jgi:hypothetical protein
VKNFFGLLIVSSGLLLGSFVPMQESAIAQKACPDVSGYWKRANGLIVNYTQKGCTFEGTVTNTPTIFHKLTGVFYDNRTADVVISRTNLSTGCQTLLYATLTFLSVPNLYRWVIYGTDGKCELSEDYTEDDVFTKL